MSTTELIKIAVDHKEVLNHQDELEELQAANELEEPEYLELTDQEFINVFFN